MKLTSCVLLMVSLVLYSSAVCCKPTIAADVLFQEGSIKLARVHADTLELVACKVKQHGVEVVIVVGHADAREPNPDALSLQRAEVVRDALVREGVEPSKVYAEGKGSKQPVSSVAEKAFANRRVELEVLFRSADGPQSDCQLRWNRELRTLGVEHALIVAKTLHKSQELKEHLHKVLLGLRTGNLKLLLNQVNTKAHVVDMLTNALAIPPLQQLLGLRQ